MNHTWVKKTLAIFFIIIISCTILSRVADSLTVPRVQVDSTNSKPLNFELYGSGVVNETKTKNVIIEQNIRVKELWVKEGNTVKAGDKLFRYELDSLKEQYSKAQKELKKQQLAYEKAVYQKNSLVNPVDHEIQEFDMEKAIKKLASAEESVKIVKQNQKKEKREAAAKARKEVIFAREEVAKAVKALEKFENDDEENKKQLEWAVEDAKTALENLNKPGTKLENYLRDYKLAVQANDWNLTQEAYTKMEEMYFGVDYKEHKRNIKEAQKKLDRAKEDLWTALESDSQEEQALRMVEDAEDALLDLTEEDTKLLELTNAYKNSILLANVEQENAFKALYRFIYKEQGVKEDEQKNLNKALEREEEKQEQAEEKFAYNKKELEEVIVKAEKERDERKEEFQKAQEAFQKAKGGVFEATQELELALEAVDQAEMEIQDKKLQGDKQSAADEIQANNHKYELEALEQERSNSQEELAKIQTVLAKDGIVTAEYGGVILKQELVEGNITSGQEKLSIAVDNTSFEVEITKEEAEPFVKGDLITLINMEEKKKEYKISDITTKEENGNKIIEVILPKEDYRIGTSLSFEIKKQSKIHEFCLPLQALRKNNEGSYVLVLEERSGILGTEQYLKKMSVTVIKKDNSSAAVKGITKEEKVVVGSNKVVNEKDRVRLYEE